MHVVRRLSARPEHQLAIGVAGGHRRMLLDRQMGVPLIEKGVFEDPIGVGPTNPTGQGVRGKAAVRDFYRKNIAPASLSIQTEESWVAGSESAHVMRLVTSFPNGVKMTVRGVFTYTVNDAGKLTNLRGYWSLADAKVERPGA